MHRALARAHPAPRRFSLGRSPPEPLRRSTSLCRPSTSARWDALEAGTDGRRWQAQGQARRDDLFRRRQAGKTRQIYFVADRREFRRRCPKLRCATSLRAGDSRPRPRHELYNAPRWTPDSAVSARAGSGHCAPRNCSVRSAVLFLFCRPHLKACGRFSRAHPRSKIRKYSEPARRDRAWKYPTAHRTAPSASGGGASVRGAASARCTGKLQGSLQMILDLRQSLMRELLEVRVTAVLDLLLEQRRIALLILD